MLFGSDAGELHEPIRLKSRTADGETEAREHCSLMRVTGISVIH
jgi:hypothetical protein